MGVKMRVEGPGRTDGEDGAGAAEGCLDVHMDEVATH